MKAKRVQHTLDRRNSVECQMILPREVVSYIAQQQMKDEGKAAGKGRGNLPTKADWVYLLLKEGYALFKSGEIDCNLQALETKGSRAIRPRIEKEFRAELEQIKPSFPIGFRGVINFGPHLILANASDHRSAYLSIKLRRHCRIWQGFLQRGNDFPVTVIAG